MAEDFEDHQEPKIKKGTGFFLLDWLDDFLTHTSTPEEKRDRDNPDDGVSAPIGEYPFSPSEDYTDNQLRKQNWDAYHDDDHY